jgi:hypothetical protein
MTESSDQEKFRARVRQLVASGSTLTEATGIAVRRYPSLWQRASIKANRGRPVADELVDLFTSHVPGGAK